MSSLGFDAEHQLEEWSTVQNSCPHHVVLRMLPCVSIKYAINILKPTAWTILLHSLLMFEAAASTGSSLMGRSAGRVARKAYRAFIGFQVSYQRPLILGPLFWFTELAPSVWLSLNARAHHRSSGSMGGGAQSCSQAPPEHSCKQLS